MQQPPHEFLNSNNANTHNASSASQDASSSDWQEFTATDGRRYYYNKRTKQSSWEKPLELMTLLERADASTVWKEFTTAEGKKYYYSKDTKLSTWTIPDELKLARVLAEKEASRGTTTKMSKKDSRCLATTSVGSKKVCGKTRNVKLRKRLEKNGKRPLPVEFEKFDQNRTPQEEGVVKRSESNTASRAQQKLPSLHGRKTYVQYIHQNVGMANVGVGHGGDAGGDPLEYWNWVAPGQCRGASGNRVRGAATTQTADEALAENGGMLLFVRFDYRDQKTFRAVGDYAVTFNNLLGTSVRRIPFYFENWRSVPEHYKDEIWQTLHAYFNLAWYLDRHELDPVRQGVEKGIDHSASERYRNSKNMFKSAWYTTPLRNTDVQTLRMHPPPDMSLQMWGRHVDFFSGERMQRIAEVNTQNREQQQYVATTGRKSMAQRRDEEHVATGLYPPMIQFWAEIHMRSGQYVSQLAAKQHAHMVQLWQQSETGIIEPMTEDEIMDFVLLTRPGHRNGRGRIVPGTRGGGVDLWL